VDEDTSAAVDGGMEATIFTAWIYDHLLPHAAGSPTDTPLVKVAGAKEKMQGLVPGKKPGVAIKPC